MGPLISQRQWTHVQRLIRAGLDAGATLITGGPGRPDHCPSGYYVQPTVFADVDLDMEVAREEIFGPVVTIIPYDTVENAIRMGNDTPYGLAAYIHGADLNQTRRVARALRAGAISMNDPALDLNAPFGGYKQSGNGRECGAFGFDDFTEIKGIIGFGEPAPAAVDAA
jgi:aldehyde dehydrogenase (NAD+)